VSRRDVVFLLADGAMEQMLCGFFAREQFHVRLGCGAFDFDPRQDIIVAPTKDPGVYNTARELLQQQEQLHERAVVILDADWKGSPGAEAIQARITESLTGVWDEFAVIVIEPELEAWIWQGSNPHVAPAFKCPSTYRDLLRESGHWPDDARKPPDPKAALTHLRRRHRADKSNAAFRRLAGFISVKGCADPAFGQLQSTLQKWFAPQ
jgi:hypothetical protein